MSFDSFANAIVRWAGSPYAFAAAGAVVVAWAASGPVFGFSDTWQLVCNTGTTIVTFLMVFLLQRSQNRDSLAVQVKLDELIRVTDARNDLIGLDQKTEVEIKEVRADDRSP